MEDEKPVLEQMTDMVVEAAHVTKEAAKKAVKKVKKVAKKVMPKKSAKKKAVKKIPRKRRSRSAKSARRIAAMLSPRDARLGGRCCGMRRASPKVSVQCVRPSSSASLHRSTDLKPVRRVSPRRTA
jgi:hypothetical protein